MFNVKCSWDGLLGGRNCSCVWSFWCSELCSVDQTVTVQRENVLDVRGPEWFYQPFCSLWISTVLGESGGLYQWFAQQSGLPSIVFWGQISNHFFFIVTIKIIVLVDYCSAQLPRFGNWAEPDSYWRAEDGFNDGSVELFQQLLWEVELPQLAKEGQLLLGLFHHGLNVIVPLQVLRNCGGQES